VAFFVVVVVVGEGKRGVTQLSKIRKNDDFCPEREGF
jgi:hypothetical protein